MAIDTETVKHVANLARLDISPGQQETYTEQLSAILDLMEQLNRVPTDGVEPMSHAVEVTIPEREDVVTNSDMRDALLACAPQSEEGHLKVPKIIE